MWSNCLLRLEGDLSDQQLNTWIRPLQVIEENDQIKLLAPNRFVLDWVKQNFYDKIQSILVDLDTTRSIQLLIEIGSQSKPTNKIHTPSKNINPIGHKKIPSFEQNYLSPSALPGPIDHNINPIFTFENFVEGKSNQLARAASIQVAMNPGKAYNPLFFTVGLVWVKLI